MFPSARSPPWAPSLSRRQLVAAGAALGAASTVTAEAQRSSADLRSQRIGIQMYSAREQVARLGFAKVLRRLADIGFKEIEFAGFAEGGLQLRELRLVLADLGLQQLGNHGGMDDGSLRAAEVLELPYTGTAYS